MVAYLRVSTIRHQGASGLGIAAQRDAVAEYVARAGCKLLTEYVETETGTKRALDNRPQLQKALAHAKRSGATLVIAKLDRLARNVAFVSSLMESGVKFVAVDFPEANDLTIHILAAVAQHEARMIAQRTRDALAAAKKRGTLLGASNPRSRNLTRAAVLRGSKMGGKRAATMHAKRADEAYSDLYDELLGLRARGFSLSGIAKHLNDLGHTTRTGKEWSPMQVSRVLERADAA